MMLIHKYIEVEEQEEWEEMEYVLHYIIISIKYY